MFDLDRLAHNACCLRRGGDRAQRFLSMLLHTCSVLSWRVLDHRRVGGERVGLQDRQHGDLAPFGQSDTRTIRPVSIFSNPGSLGPF